MVRVEYTRADGLSTASAGPTTTKSTDPARGAATIPQVARRCVLHVGTHRTGTTSLQVALHGAAVELSRRGWLYPAIGGPPGAPHGHHNVAWELTGDRRHDRSLGGVEELLAAVERSQLSVIVSSEDFGSAVFCGSRLGELVESLRAQGLGVELLVYLRNQIDFARSLYFTILNFAVDRPFADYLAEILSTGRFRWREWTFPFDYDDFVRRLEAMAAVAVRSFDEAARGSLLGETLAYLGIAGEPAILTELHLNERRDVGVAIALFCRNRLRRSLTPEEESVARALGEALGRVDLGAASCAALVSRFGASNDAVLQRHGLPPFARMQCAGVAGVERPSLETVFSVSLPTVVERLGRALATGAVPLAGEQLLAAAGLVS